MEKGPREQSDSMHQVASITLTPVGDHEIPWANNLDSFLPTLSPELSVHIFPENVSPWCACTARRCLLSRFSYSPRILDILGSPLNEAHYPAKLDSDSTTLLSIFYAPQSSCVLHLWFLSIVLSCWNDFSVGFKWLCFSILYILQHLAWWVGMEIGFVCHRSILSPFMTIKLSNQGVGVVIKAAVTLFFAFAFLTTQVDSWAFPRAPCPWRPTWHYF